MITQKQREEIAEKHREALESDTKHMSPEARSQHVQRTLVICVKCLTRPVFAAFRDRGGSEGVCLTCWAGPAPRQ